MNKETNVVNELLGKYVKFDRDGLDITAGKSYEIEDVSPPDLSYIGTPIAIYDDAGDYHKFDYPAVNYEVINYEVAEAPTHVKVGDKIHIVNAITSDENYFGTYDYCNGDILTVNYVDSGDYYVRVDGVSEVIIEEEYKVVRRAEVANKSPRKFMEGDIVRIKEYQSGFDVGTIAEVVSLSCTSKSVTTKAVQDGIMKDWYLASASCIELVAPVGARVDRVE